MCAFACVLAGHTCLIVIDFKVFPLFISVVSSLQYNCYIKYFKHLGSANKISFLNEQSLLCFIIGKILKKKRDVSNEETVQCHFCSTH